MDRISCLLADVITDTDHTHESQIALIRLALSLCNCKKSHRTSCLCIHMRDQVILLNEFFRLTVLINVMRTSLNDSLRRTFDVSHALAIALNGYAGKFLCGIKRVKVSRLFLRNRIYNL